MDERPTPSKAFPGFGKFMADKMARLNPDGLPSATGIAWYTSSTYPRCLAIFEDAADRPAAFDEWFPKAEAAEQDLRQQGMRVLRIKIDPEALRAWCHANGIEHIETHALADYVNWKVQEILRKEMR